MSVRHVVCSGDGVVVVAQQRSRDSFPLSPGLQRKRAVAANSENRGTQRVIFRVIFRNAAHLRGANTRERSREKQDQNVLLSLITAQLNDLNTIFVLTWKRKIRSLGTD